MKQPHDDEERRFEDEVEEMVEHRLARPCGGYCDEDEDEDCHNGRCCWILSSSLLLLLLLQLVVEDTLDLIPFPFPQHEHEHEHGRVAVAAIVVWLHFLR